MAEYIERDKLISDCKKRIANDWNNMVAPLSWAQAEKKFLKILEEAQTEDVALVRHGRWQKCSVGKSWWYACSVCGERPGKDWLAFSDSLSDYCPNCGARMDGEEEK